MTDRATTDLKYATLLLEASGLDPPGKRTKPKEVISPTMRENLLKQFDAKDIEPKWREKYINLVMKNWDVFSLGKYDVGHTTHYNHRIESTTEAPIFVPQFKVPIADEKAFNVMSTQLTAAKILVEQPSVNNKPIFLVAKHFFSEYF